MVRLVNDHQGKYPSVSAPVAVVVVGVDLPDHLQVLLIGDAARRGWPGLYGVVGARGNLHPGLAQDGADRLDPEPRPVLVDVVDQHRAVVTSACGRARPRRKTPRPSARSRSPVADHGSLVRARRCTAPPRW